MNRGDEDFEGGIDIHSILNDASLNEELISLGWTDMRPAKSAAPAPKGKAPPKPAKSVKAANEAETANNLNNDELIIEHLDIGDIGVVDESNLQLTEHDLQDEGLLAEFEYISGGGGAANHDTNECEYEPEAEVASVASTALVLETNQHVARTANTKPVESQATASAVVSAPNTTGIPTAEEAKRNAVKFKREGNNAEALKWLRYAKQIESNTLSTPELPASVMMSSSTAKAVSNQQSGTKASATAAASGAKAVNTAQMQAAAATDSSYSTKSAVSGDAFAPLESAINEASKAALKEAKAYEKSDTKLAVMKMREYKALQQELVVLQSRRQTPGASPALFHWQVLNQHYRCHPFKYCCCSSFIATSSVTFINLCVALIHFRCA